MKGSLIRDLFLNISNKNYEEKMKKVAIQGVQGAFHDIAAREYFSDIKIDLVECITFEELFATIQNGGCDYGMVAVENSVAGILSHNYFLLNEYSFKIVGEHYLRIVQNLIALPGSSLESLKEVRSHPIALRQCHKFLNALREKGIRIVESEDTALAAKSIAENKMYGIAAVAGELAATIYGLDVLERGIESNERNFTRFLVVENNANEIQPKDYTDSSYDKASISFTLSHEPGMLCGVLQVFQSYGLNMTMIQSTPLPGKEWEYKFFVDLVFSEMESLSGALDNVAKLVHSFTITGLYQKGETSMQPSV